MCVRGIDSFYDLIIGYWIFADREVLFLFYFIIVIVTIISTIFKNGVNVARIIFDGHYSNVTIIRPFHSMSNT